MRITVAVFSIILLLNLIYLCIDRRLFYYGKNSFDLYGDLPLKIRPEYRPDFEGGFSLKDQYGFTIAAKGNTYKYRETDVLIADVEGYCFNSMKVLAKVRDEKGRCFIIEFKDNTDAKGSEVIANVFEYSNDIYTTEGECYDIIHNKGAIGELMVIRLCVKFLVVFFVFVFVYLISRVKK